MTDEQDIIEVPLRPIVWMGDSRKNIREFPEQVRASVGYALQLVQAGETPIDAKPFKGIGSGVYEIVKRYDTDTYRAVYAVKIGEKIYVLHAFQKKSKRGIKTPQSDIDLIKKRYQDALEREKQA
ncbi:MULTISPECIES: type II toxin-antitoxin system RelE/ParE family toxin [Calothrix]|uniref:Type II toxin-antitoxin system RelE/ParE family toxin n=2 Tax=Calothrix TaxID=1186 RepID=A0ABR8AC57_9CYAN|nr:MULTISPECIES: type II toxin-antitoxin system RelE/ParE family toxin [Calothrix]MBD2196898.1 type II toxin-antitoxin system RelE/ParE family toxin [Calothrix parietina FACHB-288]MBD2225432.1 type II toxin-antitoxin system RelE/ParE family toxin [Calothrix anomala FACHB-343]